MVRAGDIGPTRTRDTVETGLPFADDRVTSSHHAHHAAVHLLTAPWNGTEGGGLPDLRRKVEKAGEPSPEAGNDRKRSGREPCGRGATTGLGAGTESGIAAPQWSR